MCWPRVQLLAAQQTFSMPSRAVWIESPPLSPHAQWSRLSAQSCRAEQTSASLIPAAPTSPGIDHQWSLYSQMEL